MTRTRDARTRTYRQGSRATMRIPAPRVTSATGRASASAGRPSLPALRATTATRARRPKSAMRAACAIPPKASPPGPACRATIGIPAHSRIIAMARGRASVAGPPRGRPATTAIHAPRTIRATAAVRAYPDPRPRQERRATTAMPAPRRTSATDRERASLDLRSPREPDAATATSARPRISATTAVGASEARRRSKARRAMTGTPAR